jgi:tRNA (mo5U34)-methyltransferase
VQLLGPPHANSDTDSDARVDRDEARRRVAQVPAWRHRIPVADGVVTPGTEDTIAEMARLEIPDDLTGQRVLDVGCSDGYYSFVAEDRGADVVAIDDGSSLLAGVGVNGFDTARALRGSSVESQRCDVHDANPDELGRFDLILFINVLYHLENPVLALRRLASVAKPGARLILKTYHRTDFRVWVRGRCLGFDIDRRPKWWFFPGTELGGDPTNWWAPNRAALLALLEATGWADAEVTGRWRDRLYVHATRSDEIDLRY